ncbi:hypothetical protein QYM36_000611, partial [Artemia franciscana]
KAIFRKVYSKKNEDKRMLESARCYTEGRLCTFTGERRSETKEEHGDIRYFRCLENWDTLCAVH